MLGNGYSGWLAALGFAALLPASAWADPLAIYQSVGGDGAAVNGNDNNTIIIKINNRLEISPKQLAKFIRAVTAEQRRLASERDAVLDARIAELDRVSSDLRATAAKNQQLLDKDVALRTAIEAKLVSAEQLQSQVKDLPADTRARAQKALDDADLDYVEALIRDERHALSQSSRGGIITALAWQRGRGPSGWAAGMLFNIMTGETVGAGGAISLRGAGLMEVLGGKVALDEGSEWRFSLAALLGPRLRIGLNHGLLIHAYYYAPLVVREAGSWSFPLVGAGTTIGYHWGFSYISAVAQFATSRPIYEHGHDTLFLGFSLGWFGML